MKRVKPIYFHDQRGFLLTFGPEDEELYRWTLPLTSERIRDILGIHTFAEIERASAGVGVRPWMRARLRTAMRAAPPPIRESEQEAPPPRDYGWPERDRAVAPRIERLVQTWAAETSRVLDPFAGPGLYPTIAAQRGAEAFWCEISPVQRFLATTRFRALFRADDERRRIAEDLFAAAGSLADEMQRGGDGSKAARLREVAARGTWTESGIARELFRAAVVSLLADGERLDAQTVANELRRLAHYLRAQQPMRTFPTLLADDARDLAAMRSIGADLLLTNPPHLGSLEPFPAAAEEFLSIDAAAERRRAVAAEGEVPRGRGTSLQRDHELRQLEQLGEDAAGALTRRLAAIARAIEEPGKAAVAARYFTELLRTSMAVERQLAMNAVAIIDVPDSWFGGQMIRNAEIVGELFGSFGFIEIASESTPVRVTGDVRKEHRVVVMVRGGRRPSSGWAAWA